MGPGRSNGRTSRTRLLWSRSMLHRYEPRYYPHMRAIVRSTLRAWARTCRAPGYLYQIVDRWGGACATWPVSTRLPGGSSITCNLTDHVQRQIFFFGAYEPIDSYLFWLLLEP